MSDFIAREVKVLMVGPKTKTKTGKTLQKVDIADSKTGEIWKATCWLKEGQEFDHAVGKTIVWSLAEGDPYKGTRQFNGSPDWIKDALPSVDVDEDLEFPPKEESLAEKITNAEAKRTAPKPSEPFDKLATEYEIRVFRYLDKLKEAGIEGNESIGTAIGSYQNCLANMVRK